jgi:hypothetical protein
MIRQVSFGMWRSGAKRPFKMHDHRDVASLQYEALTCRE